MLALCATFPALSSTAGETKRDSLVLTTHPDMAAQIWTTDTAPRLYKNLTFGFGQVSVHITAECVSLSLYLGRKSDLPECER